jgi:phosphatidylglycerol:prolipoprotein diacylglycerol transferase
LTFYWYGLLLAVGFLAGLELLLYEGRRRGLDGDRLFNMTLLIMIGSVVGARALYVLSHWSSFSGDLIGVFRIWEGGLVKHGGVIIGIAIALLYTKLRQLPILTVFDAAAPSLMLGAAVARVGCFLNGCCFGTPTELFCGVEFPEGSFAYYVFPGAHIHPTQIYAALLGTAFFAILWWQRKRVRFDGELFALYLLLDGLGRILVDAFRYYEPHGLLTVFGRTVSVSQLLSVLSIIIGVVLLRVVRGGVDGSDTEHLG